MGTGIGVEHGIAKSIRDNNPDLICFLATQTSQSTIPRIENVLGYKLEKYRLHFINQGDDVEHCYQETSKVIKKLIRNGFSIEDVYLYWLFTWNELWTALISLRYGGRI